jgi:hypothetical protein
MDESAEGLGGSEIGNRAEQDENIARFTLKLISMDERGGIEQCLEDNEYGIFSLVE